MLHAICAAFQDTYQIHIPMEDAAMSLMPSLHLKGILTDWKIRLADISITIVVVVVTGEG